jgi:hypothetical protein
MADATEERWLKAPTGVIPLLFPALEYEKTPPDPDVVLAAPGMFLYIFNILSFCICSIVVGSCSP